MQEKVEICGVDTRLLPKITKSESDELLLKIKNGDESAKNTFITANIIG